MERKRPRLHTSAHRILRDSHAGKRDACAPFGGFVSLLRFE